jgi:hypothetical protein
VRTFLAQGLWLQRAMPPSTQTIRPALEWALEVVSQGHPLPPLGFVADLGHVAFGMDWENKAGRQKTAVPNVPPNLLATYEDHVLGKIYADWTFSTAGEAVRRFREGRDRARGLAFIINQLRQRAGFAGVMFSPGILTTIVNEAPEAVLEQGLESLQKEGLHPYLSALYDSLITCTRRLVDVLGQEDILELQTGTALDEEGDRMAFRQVAQAASVLENSLPRHRVRPLPRRQEVPTRVLDEDTYPVGGFSSISNRGTIESILHSQLAYIEEKEKPDLFDIKYLRDELLFYSRDENQFLRRRRTFVFAFYPDLIERIHFKDAELPYQRGVMLLALVFVAIRKLSEWLSTDALVFNFVFVLPESATGRSREFPLETEYDLLIRLLREQAANGTVVFDFLVVGPGKTSEAQHSETEDLKRRLRDKLPQGKVEFVHVDSEEAVQELCTQRARRSLCHCLALSTQPRELEAQDVVFTQFQLDGPSPALGSAWEVPVDPEGDDPLDRWCAALKQVLARWI